MNIWLSAPEFDGLRILDGFPLGKTRHYHEWNGIVFLIDAFDGALNGLVLCESEQADSVEELRAIRFPDYAPWEVTENPFFTGGRLCRASPDQMQLEVRLAMGA